MIDLNSLTVEQLRNLNKNVIARLRELERQKCLTFRIGDQAQFKDRYGNVITGTVEKINMKTVSLARCSDGLAWRVSPGMLTRIAA